MNAATSQLALTNSNSIIDRIRMAINDGGPDFSRYPVIKQWVQPNGPHPRAFYTVKSEYAFGMSDADRKALLEKMRLDVRQSGNTLSRYNTPSSVNPDAVSAMRLAAKQWHDAPGNYMATVSSENTVPFFRELMRFVPKEHHEAASALIEQPQGYYMPLSGSRAAALWPPHSSPAASNPALSVAQPQPGGPAPNPGASSFPATTTAPWATPMATQAAPERQNGMEATAFDHTLAPSTTNKRSFSAIDTGPAASSDPTPTFKRSRPDDVNRAPPHSTAYGMPTSAPYQPMPHMQPFYDPGAQDDRFHRGGPFPGPIATGPSAAGQPCYDASGASTPYDPWFLSAHELDEAMKLIADPAPLPPATQGPLASSLPDPSALSATPTLASGSQTTAPMRFAVGAAMVQPPMTAGPSAMAPLQALPQATMPSSGPAGPTATAFDPSVDLGLFAPATTAFARS